MINHGFLDVIFVIAVVFLITGITAFALLYMSVRRHVEEALKNADSAEQARIRKQLVKAMFPPRFHR
jgi:Na+/melibiose symporter-like transporter